MSQSDTRRHNDLRSAEHMTSHKGFSVLSTLQFDWNIEADVTMTSAVACRRHNRRHRRPVTAHKEHVT